MPTPNGPKGQPRFDINDDPDFAADLTTVSEFAAQVGNRKAGTAAERQALSGTDSWPGMQFYETDTGVTYVYTSTGAVIAAPVLPRLRMQRPAAAGIQANAWQSVGMSSNAQEGGGGFTGGGASFQVPVTGRYMVNLVASAPTTASPNRRIIGVSPQSAVGTPVVQSPGFPSSGDSVTINHASEATLTAGTAYVVASYSTVPLNFTGYDVSVRLIAPTTIG